MCCMWHRRASVDRGRLPGIPPRTGPHSARSLRGMDRLNRSFKTGVVSLWASSPSFLPVTVMKSSLRVMARCNIWIRTGPAGTRYCCNFVERSLWDVWYCDLDIKTGIHAVRLGEHSRIFEDVNVDSYAPMDGCEWGK